jgi:hypothetical protein
MVQNRQPLAFSYEKMRHALKGCAFGFLLVIHISCSQHDSGPNPAPALNSRSRWELFRSSDEHFTVTLPRFENVDISETAHTNTHRLRTFTQHTITSTKGNYAYVVMWIDGLVGAGVPNSLFLEFNDSIVKSMNAKIITRLPIRYGTHTGQAVTAALPGNRMMMAREYLLADRFYRLIVIYPIDDFPQKALEKFFNSFQVRGV